MTDYYTQKDNLDWIENLEEFVAKHKEDYDLYFTTFTFQNTHHHFQNDSYQNSFKAFYQKLNQLTLNCPHLHPECKAKMILVRERSHESKVENLNKSAHYHGIVMMKKDDKIKEKFLIKCVSKASYIYNQKEQRRIRQYSISDKLIKQKRMPIQGYSVLFDIIDDKQGLETALLSIKKATTYATKRLVNAEFKKMNLSTPQINAYYQNKSVPQDTHASESVLLFCDISKFNHQKEKSRAA